MRDKLTKFLSSMNFKILYATLRAAVNGYEVRDMITDRLYFKVGNNRTPLTEKWTARVVRRGSQGKDTPIPNIAC